MLSSFDAKNIGIETSRLKLSRKPVKPLGGGPIRARHLSECQLVFRIQTTALVESLNDILILENNIEMQEGEESPRISGMDVLRNYIDCITCSCSYKACSDVASHELHGTNSD